MTRTGFVTPSGLEGTGHGASAYDMALLTREALRNPVFSEICSQSKAKVEFGNPPYERWLTNSNKLLTMYDGVKGVKTGFTDEAGRCLVSACERDGVSMICVTLNDKNDWDDHMRMYDYGFSKLNASSLSSEEIFQIQTVGGNCDSIPVKAEGEILLGTDGMTENRITSELYMPPFVYAPLNAGDEVGELRFYYDGRLIDALPVKAMKNCDYIQTDKKKKGIKEKIKEFLFNKQE